MNTTKNEYRTQFMYFFERKKEAGRGQREKKRAEGHGGAKRCKRTDGPLEAFMNESPRQIRYNIYLC